MACLVLSKCLFDINGIVVVIIVVSSVDGFILSPDPDHVFVEGYMMRNIDFWDCIFIFLF